MGVTKQVWFGNDLRIELSEKFVEHHHHIVCKKCGLIEKIASQNIEKSLEKISQRLDFKQTTHSLEVLGVCADCQNKA